MEEILGSGPYGSLQEDCVASNGDVVARGYVYTDVGRYEIGFGRHSFSFVQHSLLYIFN
jgi:hypothetical protein